MSPFQKFGFNKDEDVLKHKLAPGGSDYCGSCGLMREFLPFSSCWSFLTRLPV